jgi:hypothetical protein
MFVGDEIRVNVSPAVAAARLTGLIGSGSLSTASHEAWHEGTARVGPAGAVPGLSKLVHVRLLDPRRRGATTTLALRWEAAGAGERLFPVLDADIILVPDSDETTLIGLEGVYRPPGGRAGEMLDRAILHRVAAATIRSFLSRIADALAAPDQPGGTRSPDVATPRQEAPEAP